MNISIFLAKSLSLYLIIISVGLLLNPTLYKKLLKDFINDSTITLLGGIMALIIGILLVTVHNIWSFSWTIVVTLLAWFAFFKGISLLVFPELTINMYKKALKTKNSLTIAAAIDLLLGLFLAYQSFL